MPRPERKIIQLTIDGREVQAVEGAMLVDAAKQGDVEIPYFCYEPKLGQPVGACRMCLVEIEGIPKLQTSCSTPVRDGMVVNTQTDRVRAAQNAIVEFLLVNHPLDCPVCDKGGECPLQDITFGWGLGRSRVIEPKRHFVKPLALSPLVAIDRERCILCYRCVRFSQEIAEDWQLIFTERGAHTFVGTHDGHPYVAPFSGNIIELCPVGALTSQPYRFRARPWDIEGAGGICTLCPSQCNVTFTVRDEKVLRVLARDNDEVDDGWLCDKGRFAYQAIHVDERITAPLVRDGGSLREVSWERALQTAAAIGRHAGHVGALVGGQATNEEGFLLARLMRERLGSSDIDSRLGAPESVDLDLTRALAAPGLQATVPDLEFAHTVLVLGCEPLDDAPILDLRIRKGVRRNGVKLAIATARPSALDRNATVSVRYVPGEEAAFLAALEAALTDSASSGADSSVAALAKLLRDGGEDIVILWGERLGAEGARRAGADRRAAVARQAVTAPGCSRSRRSPTAAACARPACCPTPAPATRRSALAGAARPRSRKPPPPARSPRSTCCRPTPSVSCPTATPWHAAMHSAGLVIAHASVLTDGLAEHAHRHLPGRVERREGGHRRSPRRSRPAAARRDRAPGRGPRRLVGDRRDRQARRPRPGRPDLADGLPPAGRRGPVLRGPDARGDRRARRPLAVRRAGGGDALRRAGDAPPQRAARPAAGGGSRTDRLRLGTYRPIWASPEVEISPGAALHDRRAADRARAGGCRAARHAQWGGGRGRSERDAAAGARAVVRTGVAAGTAFLADGIAERVRQRPDRAAHRGSRRRPRSERAVISAADANYFEPWWIQIVKSIVIFGVVFGVMPILIVYERKLLGRFQNRYGPNRVGPFGLLQPLAEIVKFATKEPFRPATSVGFLFRIAPIIAIFTAVGALAIIPWGGVQNIFGTRVGLYGIDVSIGPLYVFALGGISFYGIMLGGWASGSKYSFLGAMRGAAQLISYEVSQGLALVGVIITAQTLSLTGIVNAQAAGMWYFIPQFVGFLIFMVASFAETNRAPFDLVEADAELVAGYFTEYGGTAFVAYAVRRVREHDRRLRDGGDAVPRRLADAVRDPSAGLGRSDRRARRRSRSCSRSSSGSARRCRACATTS